MAFENFKGKKFTQVTSSAEIKTKDLYRKLPAVLRLGKKEKSQGGFFSYDRILSASDKSLGASYYEENAVIVQVDTASNETFVGLTSSLFRSDILEYIESTSNFSSTAAATLSASFFSQIGTAVTNMAGAEAYVGILTSPFEVGSRGSGSEVIGPVTASVSIKETPGLAFDASGALRKRKLTYINSSSNFTNSHFFFNLDELDSTSNFGDANQIAATHALTGSGKTHLTRSFTAHTNQGAENLFYYVQSKPVPEFSIEMSSSNSVRPTASFYALTSSFSSSADFGAVSGGFIGKQVETSSFAPRFYNGTNHQQGIGDKTDGAWHFVVQKAIAEGEGENHFGESNYGNDDRTN